MSEPASEQRPRPQYGEYATPEEQRARIAQPDVSAALGTGQSNTAGADSEAVAHTASTVAGGPTAAAATAAAPRHRTVDRIVTIGLLVYGLINVVTSFGSFLDYYSYAETMFALMGVDAELTNIAAARPWGIAAALVLAIGWVATAALSWWSLSRARVTWWIPLVGGVLFTFIAGVLMAVPLMNDTAVWNALLDSVR